MVLTWSPKYIFYCSQQHKFAIQAMLCNIQYIYILDGDIYSSTVHKEHIATLPL